MSESDVGPDTGGADTTTVEVDGTDPSGAAGLPAPPEPSNPRREGTVRVVGTAHVSTESVEEVERVVDEERPDVVAVELDEGRYRQMEGETPDDIDAADLLRGNTVFQFLAYWMLSYVQSRMGDRFDITPGAEMRAAIEAGRETGAGVALVDRDIQVTVQRFWHRMTAVEKVRTVAGLAFGVADPPLVAVAAGAMFGVVLGPVLGIAAGAVGVPATTMAALATGGLGTVAVGYAFLELGLRYRDEDWVVGVAALGGTFAGLAVATTGPAVGVVESTLGGLVFLLGGVTAGVAVGLLLGGVGAAILVAAGRRRDPVEDFDIDDLTDADVVTALLEEFRRFSPGGAEALIDERDAYIAHNLLTLRERGYDVVAVVGAGHRAGIEGYLADPETLPPFDSLVGEASGRRFSVGKALGYLITLGFVGFFLLLVLGGAQRRFLLELFGAWFLFNGTFAFGLAKLAGARWVSAGVGGLVAWLTSVNPLLAPGWFAGYVELRSRPVNVADIATLNDILGDESLPIGETLDRMMDVSLFRLMMVVALTNVGSMVASFLFPFVILPLVAPGNDVASVGDLMLDGARNGAELLFGLLR